MSGAPKLERFRENLVKLIDNVAGRRIDYSQFYTAVVTAQNADGTLQLIVDDPKMRGTGANNIQIRSGLPGVRLLVSQGARVRVGFENNDPSKPFAALWDTGAAFVRVDIGDNPEFVALSNLVKDELDLIRAQYNTHVHLETGGSTAVPTVLMAPIGDVAATKVRVQ